MVVINFREEAAYRLGQRKRFTCLPAIVGDYPTMTLQIPYARIDAFERWFHNEDFRVDITECKFVSDGDYYDVALRGSKKSLMMIKLAWSDDTDA